MKYIYICAYSLKLSKYEFIIRTENSKMYIVLCENVTNRQQLKTFLKNQKN